MSKVKHTPAQASPIFKDWVACPPNDQPRGREDGANRAHDWADQAADHQEQRDWQALQAVSLARVWGHPADDVWNDA